MTNTATRTVAKPTHHLYHVTSTGKQSTWTEIGAAWPNRDGNGFSITCTAVPLEGRIVMRKAQAGAQKAA